MMKLINSELEYRTWMVQKFFLPEDDIYNILSPDDIELELMRQRPEKFPCIALIIAGPDHRTPAVPFFIYCNQIHEWATEMGLIPLS